MRTTITAHVFRYAGIKKYGEMKTKELIPRAEFISSRAADLMEGILSRKDFENIVNYDRRIWDAAPYLYTADGTLFGSITNDQLEANTNMIAPYLAGVLAGREVSAVVMMGGSRAGVVVGEPITASDGAIMGAVFLVKPMDELSTGWGNLTSSLPLAMLLVALIMVPVA